MKFCFVYYLPVFQKDQFLPLSKIFNQGDIPVPQKTLYISLNNESLQRQVINAEGFQRKAFNSNNQ